MSGNWPLTHRRRSLGRVADVGALIEADRPTFLPSPRAFRRLTGLTPEGYRRADDFESGLIDIVGGGTMPEVGSPTYRNWNDGWLGVLVDADTEGFALASAHAPEEDDWLCLAGLIPTAHAAATKGVVGYRDNTGGDLTSCYSYVGSDDKVHVYLADPGETHFSTAAFADVVEFGAAYALAWHLCRTTGLRYGGLVHLASGDYQALTPASIAAFNSIIGGTAPKWNVGYFVGAFDGDGIVHLGHAVVRGGARLASADAVPQLFEDLGLT